LLDEMFWAEKGIGAFINHRRLRVSAREHLRDAVIATGIPHLGRAAPENYLPQLGAVMGAVAGIRRAGSAALDLAYVAAGRYDGFWEQGLSPWDIAAGILIVREAGGLVSEVEGGGKMLASGSILATNGGLYTVLGETLRHTKA
ncbi:MAG: inositol monophosphatase family protein, partial [Alphaproteobacteria bacterium]